MLRDEFATVDAYHKYLEEVEKDIYPSYYFDRTPEDSISLDELGIEYYSVSGVSTTTHCTRPMFTIKHDLCGGGRVCWTCNARYDKDYWTSRQDMWDKYEKNFKTSFNRELAATAGHP